MKRYDVIIVGGGLGGLACGCILSKEGLSVCILEKHTVIGGCLQSFRRGGYVLDTGMHYVGSLSEGQIMHRYFKYFGIADKLRTVKLDEAGFDVFLFPDGSRYCHAMGYERFEDELSARFPQCRRELGNFCGKIRSVGELISPEILQSGRLSAGGMEYMGVSAYDEICRDISDERLRNVLAGSCGLYAGDKSTTSLYEYSMIMHSNIEGAYCFADGSQQIADAMVGIIRTNGGDVTTGAEVTGICLDGDKVRYIETSEGERYEASYVISSLHPSLTFSLLRNNEVYKKAFFTRIGSLRNTYGLFTTYLLLKPGTLEYENRNVYLYNNDDVWSADGDYKGWNIPYTLLCMQPNSRDGYTDVVTLLTPMHYSYCERWADTESGRRGAGYEEFKDRFSDAVIDFACGFYPGLRQCILRKCTASPLTYRDYTGTPEGSAYGLVKDWHNPIVTAMSAKTRISNFFLTGQNLNLHGCIGTSVSAAVTCSEILGVEYLAKKIGNA